MKGLLAFLIALAGLAVPAAEAQWTAIPKGSSITPYTGPGDIVSFADWWGLRAYSGATRGSAAANVCTAQQGGGSCADFNTSTITGDLIVTTIAGTNCAVSNCYVFKLYDQASGGTPVSNSFSSTGSPLLITSCLNSMPCMRFNGTSNTLCGTSLTAYSQPLAHYAVGERTAAFTTAQAFTSNFNVSVDIDGPQVGPASSANTGFIYAGSVVTAAMTDSAWHVLLGLFNGASSIIAVDNVEATVNPGTGGTTAPGMSICLGEDDINGTGGWLSGQMVEAGFLGATISSGNRTSICHNAYTFWATPTSC